jgi:maltose alpha-D-glucosyltransferase/alpha-amylase
MAFHFPVMPRLYMALKREDRAPIVDILRRTPDIPVNCQWATFLRNHDELTLEMVTLDERHYMWDEYAPEARMRINLGIRRRLAPLLDNGRPETELLNALFLSLPGSPCLYYGDEIGMGDNIWLRDRNGVRTPMQWSADRNAGFSLASWSGLYAPVVSDSTYGYQTVNVESQHRTPTSLLNWVRRTITVRKQYKAFGRGNLDFILPDNPHIIAYVRRYEQETIVCVANLARTVQFVELNLAAFEGGHPCDLFGNIRFPQISGAPYALSLPARGFFWFRIER